MEILKLKTRPKQENTKKRTKGKMIRLPGMFLRTGNVPGEEYKKDKRILGQPLTPMDMDRFKVVASLNRELCDAVSFEYKQKPDWYITCKKHDCIIAKRKNTLKYERHSSFFPLPHLWYDGYTVFESTTDSGWYLRLQDRCLSLQRYDGTELFKQEASFQTRIYDVGLKRSTTTLSSHDEKLTMDTSLSSSVDSIRQIPKFPKI